MARAPRGTGFIDFGRYLSANRPQAEAMSAKIADPLEKEGAKVQDDLTALQTDFEGRIAGGQNLDAMTDEQLRQAGAGELSFEGFDPKKTGEVAKAAGDVQRKTNLLGSTGGIASSIQDFVPKTSSYGLGMNMLDAGLTGAAGGERFQGLQNKYGGIFGKVTGAAKGAQEKALEATKAAQANKGLYSGELATREAVRADAADRPRQEAEAAEMKRQREEAARRKRLERSFAATPGRTYDYSPIFGTRGGGRG